MDHLARIAMKNAANCVKYGEMQGYRNRYMSNAYCGPVIHLTGPHLSEGLLNITNISSSVRAVLAPERERVLGFTLAVVIREHSDRSIRVLPVRFSSESV